MKPDGSPGAAGSAHAEPPRTLDRRARRAELKALKLQADAERAHRRQARAARREAERLALDAIAAAACQHYEHVREWAKRMQTDVAQPRPLSEAEQQMIAGLAPLWNAPPDAIAQLRRWCEPVSGVRSADYDPPSEELALRLRRDLYVLRKQMRRRLFVQESPALGGFGYCRDGELYNEETLKCFHVLAALEDGAVLGACDASERRLVWEIGGAWGGFAYQFKTICPNTTYLITGLPDVLRLSAVYLMAVFPDARCRFFDNPSAEEFWRGWEHVDFLFAPEGVLATLRPPRLDLTLDVMALRNMPGERVRVHVERAFDFASRYFYSLAPATDRAPEVWNAVERCFWPHPLPPRGAKKQGVVGWDVEPATDVPWKHLIGWKRLRVS